MGLREKHRRQRTQQVLDAAQMLFGSRGYEATHIDAIAEKASVAPATVYNYFETKPNLLMALVIRHVHISLPERRRLIRNLPDDPVAGMLAFERLLADQAMRNLSRDCWRVITAARFTQTDGRPARISARLGLLIQRQYVRLIRTYQERGRIQSDVDPVLLAELVVGVTTHQFHNFVASSTTSVDEMLAQGARHIRLIVSKVEIRAD